MAADNAGTDENDRTAEISNAATGRAAEERFRNEAVNSIAGASSNGRGEDGHAARQQGSGDRNPADQQEVLDKGTAPQAFGELYGTASSANGALDQTESNGQETKAKAEDKDKDKDKAEGAKTADESKTGEGSKAGDRSKAKEGGSVAGNNKPKAPVGTDAAVYDRTKADQLIQRLDNNKKEERDKAQKQLEEMGTAVIPQLARAAQLYKGDPKTNEMGIRAENALQRIKNKDRLNTADAVMPDWSDLLKSADFSMDNEPRMVGEKADENNNSQLHMLGYGYLNGNDPKGITSKDQENKFDKLIEKLDGIKTTEDPDFRRRLTELNKALTGADKNPPRDLTPQESHEHQSLFWLNEAKTKARLYYAESIAASREGAIDHDKGGKMLTEYLKRTDETIDSSKNARNEYSDDFERLAVLASKFGISNNADFQKAFAARGGSIEALKEFYTRYK